MLLKYVNIFLILHYSLSAYSVIWVGDCDHSFSSYSFCNLFKLLFNEGNAMLWNEKEKYFLLHEMKMKTIFGLINFLSFSPYTNVCTYVYVSGGIAVALFVFNIEMSVNISSLFVFIFFSMHRYIYKCMCMLSLSIAWVMFKAQRQKDCP